MQNVSEEEKQGVLGVWWSPKHTFLRIAVRRGENEVTGIFVVDSSDQCHTQKPLRYVSGELLMRALSQISTLLTGLIVKGLEDGNSRAVTFEELLSWMHRYRVYMYRLEELQFTALCLIGKPFEISVRAVRIRPTGRFPLITMEISGALEGKATFVINRSNRPDRIHQVSEEIQARYPKLFTTQS